MKQELTLAAMDTQTAFELPSRDMLALVTVVVTNLLNNNTVNIPIKNNNVAVQVCAAVNALNAPLALSLTCEVGQR